MKVVLTAHGKRQLAVILVAAGQVFLAAVFIPYFLEGINFVFGLSGLGIAVACWLYSVIIIEETYDTQR